MATIDGTAGNDSLVGTRGKDEFHLEQGGDDTALGGGRSDVFYLGGALTSDDRIDGGEGNNSLMLDGDYSAGVSFGADTLKNIILVKLAAGFDYRLEGIANTSVLLFDGTALGADDQLIADATGGARFVRLYGGDGDDLLRGGANSDDLSGGRGHNSLYGGRGDDSLSTSSGMDFVNGGAGDDTVHLHGTAGEDRLRGGDGVNRLEIWAEGQTIVLQDATIRDFSLITVANQGLNLTLADGNLAAGKVLTINAGSGPLSVDGSAETDGSLHIKGGDAADLLIGGAGDDILLGGSVDTLRGGAGNDELRGGPDGEMTGGLGQDLMVGGHKLGRFVFETLQDSTTEAPDTIRTLGGKSVIDLSAIDADATQAGDQAFHLVNTLAGHAGELTMSYDSVEEVTALVGDVDGDGEADFRIDISGDRTDFANFAL